MIAGSIAYTSQRGGEKFLWIVDGCEVFLLEHTLITSDGRINYKSPLDGRINCIRVSWPSGYDIIISADTEMDCKNWFDFLGMMVYPPPDVMKRRNAILGFPATQALLRASIRSHKSSDRVVKDLHNLRFKEKAYPKLLYVAPKVVQEDSKEDDGAGGDSR